MNNNEVVLLAWHKGSKDSPWVLAVRDSKERIREITVGEGGYVSAGSRLEKSLEYMNNEIVRYPMRYNMQNVKNLIARTAEVTTLSDKIMYIETNEHFEKEILKSYKQTPFEPIEEVVEYQEKSRYIESPKSENMAISTYGYKAKSTSEVKENEYVTLLKELADNTNVFWLFMHPDNLKVTSSDQLEGFIDAYNWPEGHIIPEEIGIQNILDSQRTVTIDLLGMNSFNKTVKLNEEDSRAYGLFKEDPKGRVDSTILPKVEKEAITYMESFLNEQNVIAVSLQYSRTTNGPIMNGGKLLGVAYGTDFKTLQEVESSIANGNFRAVNLNKSLLKEKYSQNWEVKNKHRYAADIPLVKFLNQSATHEDHALNPSVWLSEAGIQQPPTISDYNEMIKGFDDAVKTEDEILHETIEDEIEKNVEEGFNSKDHYVQGYVNNDLAFIPAKDDRVESGEIYGYTYQPNPEDDAGQMPYDYTHKVRIGDVLMEVPPLSIRSDKEQANESISILRSRNGMQKGIGSTRQVLTLDLYFHDLENINGHEVKAFTRENGEQVYYYMDGLRTLLAQFMKSPFVPIDNEYVNDSLGVHNVAMRDIQASTVEGFPEALSVTLVLEEVDVSTYMMGVNSLGLLMNYPLYRWYYQQALQEPKQGFSTKTHLPKIKSLDNTFSFRIASESYLRQRTNTIRRFNGMKKPRALKAELDKKREKEGSDVDPKLYNKRASENALASYYSFQNYYNGLSQKTKEKYSPAELPIITRERSSVNLYNLKEGKSIKMEDKEYELALSVGRNVYGAKVSTGGITNLPHNFVKTGNKPVLTSDEAIFISSYQLGVGSAFNKMIRDSGLPGAFQIGIKSKEEYDKIKELVRKAMKETNASSNYSDKSVKWKETLGTPIDLTRMDDSGTFLIPAGTIGGIDFLSILKGIGSRVVDEDADELEKHTYEYNKMAEFINMPESDIPMHDWRIDKLIPLSLNVAISNNLSLVQTQAAETPSLQYLGSQQPEIQLTFSTNDRGAEQVDNLFRTVGRYAKEYRIGLVSNFLEIVNPLVNLFGVNAVLPNTFQINTVEGNPGEKIITMIFTGFDTTQRKQEALNQFVGGKTTKSLNDLHLSGYDPKVNSIYIHEKIKHMELYPDLELPTYDELEEDLEYLDSGVSKLENRRGQVYLDPDFYVSTETTVRKELQEILGRNGQSEIKYIDDLGIEVTSDPINGEQLNVTEDMVNIIKELEEDDDFADSDFEWEEYEGLPGDSVAKDKEQDEQDKENILITGSSDGKLIKISRNDVKEVFHKNQKAITQEPTPELWTKWADGVSFKDVREGKGNPTEDEVWAHLFNEVQRMFPEVPGVKAPELNMNIDDFNNMNDEDLRAYLTLNNTKYKDEIKHFDVESVLSDTDSGVKLLAGLEVSQGELDVVSLSPIQHLFKQMKAVGLNFRQVTVDINHSGNGIPNYTGPSDYEGLLPKGTRALVNGIYDTDMGVHSSDTEKGKTKKIKNHEGTNGDKYSIAETHQYRIFMYMKNIINLESGWRQFDEEGQPITKSNSAGVPYKVGVMGAPIHRARTREEALRIAWDWKYNITFSLIWIKSIYEDSVNNHYFDYHLRPLDWATLSHSGVVLPPSLESPKDSNDIPYTESDLKIMPESINWFKSFGAEYTKSTALMKKGDSRALFTTPNGLNYQAFQDVLGYTEEEAGEKAQEYQEMESNNFDEYTLEDKVRSMYTDMQEFNQVGRLVRAFPSFSLMLIDEGKWFQNFRTWDNFYGYNSLHSIDVYKSRKIAADTAVITMSNMYGNLTSTESNPGEDLPSFFSSQFWQHYVLGKPTDYQLDGRAEIYDQMMLQTGARVHLRMGYGADASALPIMFNGSISELSSGEVIEFTAQGDAVEMQNVISGSEKDKNMNFFRATKEPRRTIGELMTSKGNWFKEGINHYVDGQAFFKENASGLVHFGSTIESEEGNREFFFTAGSEEFGESLQNVYSQNGMETKSQWHFKDGEEMNFIEKAWANRPTSFRGAIKQWIGGATGEWDEDNITVSYYGRTVWDIVQTFALASQDYIAAVVPYEYRSTLFFGKPHWMLKYAYDSDFIYDSDLGTITRVISDEHHKTFMQAHIFNSHYNILTNNIMVSEDGVFNNVIVTYDGRTAGAIQADSDIRLDKQRTIDVEANILSKRLRKYYKVEHQTMIYGQSTLRDFMKDMYKGDYTVMGDPTLKPYDIVYMNDTISDIHGIHLVKAVHHSMDGEHGFVSTIEPDAYVYNFDSELAAIPGAVHNIGKETNMTTMFKTGTKFGSAVVVGSLASKLLTVLSTKYKPSIMAAAKAKMSGDVMSGITKYSTAKSLEVAGNLINKGGTTVKLANEIKVAKSAKEVTKLAKAARASLKAEVLATGGTAENVTLFTKLAGKLVDISAKEGSQAAIRTAKGVTKTTGDYVKVVAGSSTAMTIIAIVVMEIATASISEWWARRKQNAEAIKVIPLTHKGQRWTALMNWHKGSVKGDDPSLRDKLMEARFFDKDIDPEVNEIWFNSVYKTMNLLFD